MKKTRLAVTGLSGVLGKVFLPFLKKNYKVIDLYHKKPAQTKGVIHISCDLLNKESIEKVIQKSKPDAILHMAALTHIDRCEEDREQGKNGDVWKINVEATEALVKEAKKIGAHFVFLSSECVFNGRKKEYREHDKKHPKNWYGITKSEAENRVLKSGALAAIVRSTIAYGGNRKEKTIFGTLYAELQKKTPLSLVRDQYITPTYMLKIAEVVDQVLKKGSAGIYHVAPSDKTTPYLFAKKIAQHFHLDIKKIKGVTMAAHFGKQRAKLRLHHACLNAEQTYRKLNIAPHTTDEIFDTMIT